MSGWHNATIDHSGPQDGGGGRACFNCGQEGHNKAECPNPRVLKCRHCNEDGHTIRGCPTAPPQEFTGECRFCKKEGHMAKDCPDKPPMVCKNCLQEGHTAALCKNPRKIDRSSLGEIPAEVAWAKIMAGAKEKDLDKVKEGIQEYLNATPGITYVNLEQAFRSQFIELHLIALEDPALLATHTHMDLQGNLDKKYRVHYRWSDKPLRPREVQQWPQSAAENLERLKDAGETVERGIPKCTNCGEIGHRIRDCPEPRKNKYGCRNCGQGGHMASDCPEPRRARDDVECRKCGGTGHFAKDCPQEGGGRSRACFNCGEEGHGSRDCPNPKKIQCRNCDEFGHMSKECPKPRDYSRVKCTKCGEMGHTQVRCKMESAPIDEPTFDAVDGSVGYPGGNSFPPAPAAPETGAGDNWGSNDNVNW
ncbi:Zinc finger protein GIS2 [Daldinia childiae]|uniref:Zinc finger protein GIS2 n=1 Tax=Daldinia childiae TaxID=326645 RepID=UPI001447EE3C|nr:Zinc finger protein GIS2 [Daldinia childiae]KAF3058289.1 Zinc finger protein GIS2 [Daldinia childiae]